MAGKNLDKREIVFTDEFKIIYGGTGWTLYYESSEVKKVRRPKTGEMVDSRETSTKYFGSLYQALQGFVREYYELKSNSLEDVVKNVEYAVGIVNSAMEAMTAVNKALVEKYKTVKVSNN